MSSASRPGMRGRALTAAVFVAIHLAAFGPTIGESSSILENGFWIQAERVLDGEKPYSEVEFEYPPLALPLIVGPAVFSDGLQGYEEAFELEQLGFDLAIVLVLAFGVQAPRRRVWEALGIYTVGVVAVSGIVLGDSVIEAAPLALARFDLLLALLILGAVLARERGRTILWSLLLGAATAVKAFPLLLFPNLFRDDRHPRRAVIFALVPIFAAALVVVGFVDEFGSAIGYHTDRDLQIETLGAAPILVSHLLFGSEAGVITGAGGYNIDAPAADLLRGLSIALLLAGAIWLIAEGWRRRTRPLIIATAVLTVAIVFAPVLSPQFLFWVLPLSAVAYGLGRENLVLIACLVLTQIVLHHYDGVYELRGDFVWPLAARNALLLVYLGLVIAPVFRSEQPWTNSSSSPA